MKEYLSNQEKKQILLNMRNLYARNHYESEVNLEMCLAMDDCEESSKHVKDKLMLSMTQVSKKLNVLDKKIEQLEKEEKLK